MKASKQEFIGEAEDLLFECQQLILEIQDTYQTYLNPDTINALFRSIHTLKGLSGLFGNTGMTDLSHALESLLDDLRLGKLNVNDHLIDFLFSNLDILRSGVEAIKDDKEKDFSESINAIKSFRESQRESESGVDLKGIIDDSILKVLSEYEEHRLKANVQSGLGIYFIRSIFELETFDTSLEEISQKIKSFGELVSTLPVSADVPDGSIGFNLLFSSTRPAEDLAIELDDSVDTLIEPKVLESPQEKKKERSIKSSTTTVRVDIDKLDRILNTIGELTLTKDAVKRIGGEMTAAFPNSELTRDTLKISQVFERRLIELQEEVLAIRMVPIGQLFSRLAQVIRRHARETGKEISIMLYGEDTELDKSIAEEIIDPMMHLVRNSIDHGLETIEEREQKGKLTTGIISLKAYQTGSYVVIEVFDDGRGIDLEQVKKKAIEKGMLDPNSEAQKNDLLDLVFMPGLSTKDTASEISGRGVGLDIVKDKLSTLGGFVDVYTEINKGTTFILTIPITLAIIKALIVRVGEERFALPLTAITETVVVEHKDIQTIEWKNVYYIRGEMLPIISLEKIFAIETEQSEMSFAVVVGSGRRKVGLLVDEILGQQEIVIKSLGEYFKGLTGFAGAAEIGRHEVVLVLDIESVIEKSLLKQEGLLHV
jgi:two-component system chemotaxis sensor kinase CheA